MQIITLLTDFGDRDYYVAAVKGVILATARAAGDPPPTLVDLSHAIEPGDVEGAAFLLAAAAPTFPTGTIHLAVVDPGVGSDRQILAAERRGHRFLAPDNGLLTPLLAAAEVVRVERPDLYRPAPGHTFHGRDRFAPLAAALAGGSALADLGPRAESPVRLDLPPPSRRGGELHGRVVHVDRFGNLVTDLPADWLPVAWLAGDQHALVPIRVADQEATIRRVGCYSELHSGEVGLLVGSLATLELSLPGDSLATHWGVARGARVRLDRARPAKDSASGSVSGDRR